MSQPHRVFARPCCLNFLRAGLPVSQLFLAAVVAMTLTGCAVPLGPGFRLHSRQMALAAAPAAPAPIHLRVTDRMENTGNRALSYLDVSLPRDVAAAKDNLTIRIDGKPVTPVAESEDPDAPLRVRFDPPWPAKQTREVVLEYDRSTDAVTNGVSASTAEGFYFADPRALPLWLTPVGFFASGEILSRDERFELTLPADFHIAASGRQERRRSANGSTTYRFRTKGTDLPSFVIAGRYQEQLVRTQNGSLLFWTFQPLDPNAARAAAERLTATAATLVRIFGPLPSPGPLRVVEAPAGVLALNAAGQPAAASAFPEGLLLGPRAFAQGIASEAMLRVAEADLVRVWFGWRILLRPDTDTLLGRGLGLFAIALAAEARGGQDARRIEIVRLLEDYDRARVPSGEGPMLQAPADSTPQQLAANSFKAALFLAALDDLAGGDKFESAIRRMQANMAGRGLYLSLDDLRSALETSTGEALADVFRQWLTHPGVPDDFRARYSTEASPQLLRPAAVARRVTDSAFDTADVRPARGMDSTGFLRASELGR